MFLILNNKEKKKLIELICDKQMDIIIKNPQLYESDEYKDLENLKIRVKDADTIEDIENKFMKKSFW